VFHTYDFAETGKSGQKMARLKLEPDWIWEPTLISSSLLGIIAFIDNEIPPNWTHMVIRACSASMRESPRRRGGAVFLEVPPPCMELQDYAQWRKYIAQRILLQDDERFDTCLALTKKFPAGTAEKRLVFHKSEIPGVEFEYQHFEDSRVCQPL
jgi:hypothetical protein